MKTLDAIDANGRKVVNLATPTAAADAATKQYVDDNAGGGSPPPWLYLPDGWDTVWRAALAASGSAPAYMTVLGDSFTMGLSSTDCLNNGYIGLLAQSLYTTYGHGGDMYSPTESLDYNGTYTGTSPWSGFGGGTRSYLFQSYSKTLFWSSGTGALATFTSPYACVKMDILYWDFAAGTFNYSLDGAAAVTVTLAGDGVQKRLSLTGLASTTHTIAFSDISPAGTFAMGLMGIICYASTTAGVLVARLAHGFSRGTDWMQTPQIKAGGATLNRPRLLQGSYGSNARGFGFPAQPHLALMAYGITDCVNSVSVTDYQNILARLVRALRYGRDNCSILMVAHHVPDADSSESQAQSNAANYHNYLIAMRSVAEAYNCAWANVNGKWSQQSVTKGFATSGDFHPTNAGHQDIADLLEPLIV